MNVAILLAQLKRIETFAPGININFVNAIPAATPPPIGFVPGFPPTTGYPILPGYTLTTNQTCFPLQSTSCPSNPQANQTQPPFNPYFKYIFVPSDLSIKI